MSKYRIAIVMWPIMEVGGIATYLANLQAALQNLGHSVDFYHARERGYMRNLSKTTPVLAGRDVRLPGGQFKYGDKEDRKAAKKLLNSYDLVIMGHQCPHPNIRGEGSRAWQSLYDLKVPIFAVFHDNIWQRAYPWLAEVAENIDVCLYTNPSIWVGSAQAFPGYFVYTPQLLDTIHAGLYRSKKKERVVWLPQWKNWKGIGLFVRALPDINYETHLYNSGIEYHYLKKEKDWSKWITEDEYAKHDAVVPPNGFHVPKIVKGPRLLTKIPGILKRANISVDLTGYRTGPFLHQTTYVHFESMVYGAIVVAPESVAQKPSPIPDDCIYTIPTGDEPLTAKHVAKSVNWLMRHEKYQIRTARKAVDWVTSRFDDERIASGIISLLERKIPKVTKATRGSLYE